MIVFIEVIFIREIRMILLFFYVREKGEFMGWRNVFNIFYKYDKLYYFFCILMGVFF